MNSATNAWSGLVLSIQPRIRPLRSFDQRTHTYLGYVVQLAGSIEDEPRTFAIAIGEAAHARNAIQVGDALSGVGDPVANPRSEVADLYKIRRLTVERQPRAVPSRHRRGKARPLNSPCTVSAATAASPRGPTPHRA